MKQQVYVFFMLEKEGIKPSAAEKMVEEAFDEGNPNFFQPYCHRFLGGPDPNELTNEPMLN